MAKLGIYIELQNSIPKLSHIYFMQLCIDHEGIINTTGDYDSSLYGKVERPH